MKEGGKGKERKFLKEVAAHTHKGKQVRVEEVLAPCKKKSPHEDKKKTLGAVFF